MLNSKGHWFGITILLVIMIGTVSVPARGEEIEMANGEIISGTVKTINDTSVILTRDDVELDIAFKDIRPKSVYALKLTQIDPKDPAAHLILAEYCLENKLYDGAIKEFNAVVLLDESRKDEITEKIDIVIEQEITETLSSAFNLMRENKYKETLQSLQAVLKKYPESKYTEELTKAVTFAREVIDNKLAEEQRRKEQERLAKIEAEMRTKFNEAAKLMEETRLLNEQGLAAETESKIPDAVKCYKTAEEKLLLAKYILTTLLSDGEGGLEQIKNPDFSSSVPHGMVATIKDSLKETSRWFLIIYNNLGLLWMNEGNLKEAIKWVNKALTVEPDNKTALELKVKIAEIEARRKVLQKENR